MSLKITVFGASGHIGRLVVDEALRRGYEVVAFTHSKPSSLEKPGLSFRQGNVNNPKDVAAAIEGSSAVISALGSWGTPSKDILTTGMSNIIPAMKKAGVKRIVSLTGSDARASGDTLSLLHRFSRGLLKIIGGKILQDGEKHIELLEGSGLDWTIVRSPRMTKKGTNYKLTDKRSAPWASVGREAVAECLLNLIDSGEHIKQAPFITRD